MVYMHHLTVGAKNILSRASKLNDLSDFLNFSL